MEIVLPQREADIVHDVLEEFTAWILSEMLSYQPHCMEYRALPPRPMSPGSRAGQRSSASSVGSVRSSRSANHQLRVYETQQRQEQLQEEQAKLLVLESHQARTTAAETPLSTERKHMAVLQRHQQDMRKYASAS